MGEKFGFGRNIMTVPLIEGLNQESSDYSSDARLVDVFNCEYTKKNTIKRRPGWERKSTNNYSKTLSRMVSYNNSVIGFSTDGTAEKMVDNTRDVQQSLNHLDANDNVTFYLPEFINESTTQVAKLDQQLDKSDIASSSKYDCIAYVENGSDVWVLFKSREDGSLAFKTKIWSQFDVGSIKCVDGPTDGYFVVAFNSLAGGDEGEGYLYYKVFDVRADTLNMYPTLGVSVVGNNDFKDGYNAAFDVCKLDLSSSIDGWAFAWNYSDGLYVKSIRISGVDQVSERLVAGRDGPYYGISLHQNLPHTTGDRLLWLFYHKADGFYGLIRNASTLFAFTNEVQISSVVEDEKERPPAVVINGEANQFVYVLYWDNVEYDEDYPSNGIPLTALKPLISAKWIRLNKYLDKEIAGIDIMGLHPLTKGFKFQSKMFVWLADFCNRTAYLINLPEALDTQDPPYPVYRVVTMAQFNKLWAGVPDKLYNVSNPETGVYTTGCRAFIKPLIGENLSNPNQDYKTSFVKLNTVNDNNMYETEIVDGTMYVGGGLLMNYDGVEFNENNFVQQPVLVVENIDSSPETYQPTDAWATGVWGYTLVFEYIDNLGNHHRSAPSAPQIFDSKRTPGNKVPQSATSQSVKQYLAPGKISDTPDLPTEDFYTFGYPDTVDHKSYEMKVTQTGGPLTGRVAFKQVTFPGDASWGPEQIIPSPGAAGDDRYLTFNGFRILFKDMSYTANDIYSVNYFTVEGSTALDIDYVYIGFTETNRFKYYFGDNDNPGELGPDDPRWINNNGADFLVSASLDKDGYFHLTTDGYQNGYGTTHFNSPNETGLKVHFDPTLYYWKGSYVHVPITNRSKPYVSLFVNNLTYRHNNKSILSVYRTTKNGEIYHRMAGWEDVETFTMQAGDTGLVNNPIETTKIRYTFYDNSKDDEVQYHEALYAPPDGQGELPSDHPYGGVKSIKYHNDRLFMVSAENPATVMYSKPFEKGKPLSYSLGQELVMPEPITGFASHDDKLIAFSKNLTYVISGTGPDATGDPRSGFFDVYKLNGVPGCSTSRSIQTVDVGTFYHSPVGGLKLLDKANALYDLSGVLASANRMDGESIIYDSVNVATTNKQYILMVGDWSYGVLMINYADMIKPDQAAARMSYWGNSVHGQYMKSKTYYCLNNNTLYMAMPFILSETVPVHTKLLYQDDTKFVDAGNIHLATPTTNYYTSKIETGWWNIQSDAIKRIRKVSLNGYSTNNGVTLTVRNSNWNKEDTETWSSVEVDENKTRDLQLIHPLKYQKGRAFKFIIESAAPSADNEGVLSDAGSQEWHSIAFEISSDKPGLRVGQIGVGQIEDS